MYGLVSNFVLKYLTIAAFLRPELFVIYSLILL
jgi:hypothetical protein